MSDPWGPCRHEYVYVENGERYCGNENCRAYLGKLISQRVRSLGHRRVITSNPQETSRGLKR